MARKKQTKIVKPKTLAQRADKYALYQQAVQEPGHEVEFLGRLYRRLRRRPARVLREDFCGTFAVCCEWVRINTARGCRAIGVDLDPRPLAWGRRHNLAKLPKSAQKRVQLVQADVKDRAEATLPGADILVAQNFSFWIFRTRKELREYFDAARSHLAPKGLFVLDMLGGHEVLVEDHQDEHRLRGRHAATYVWDQARFDPITHHARFHIHFRFKDGSELRRAFTYDWRLWSLPEVRELLAEAGFARSTVYWEGTNKKTGQGNGVYAPRQKAESDPAWIAYVVAEG
ncbi:MAG: class I SAM-dependent methyltransferase [Phycisphaeraceae bacterium]|nr:class I SAM-dependent methyltransferase [Phycisphaeraceae bacterium]